MIRVIRVLNLAKFVPLFKAMHRMVTSLSFCITPMLNAFFMLMVLTTIYAVLGTHVLGARNAEFFGDFQVKSRLWWHMCGWKKRAREREVEGERPAAREERATVEAADAWSPPEQISLSSLFQVVKVPNSKPQTLNLWQTSLFTLFQVLSGDSWASSIARSMFVENERTGVKQTDSALAFFFVSYFILANIILLNVVVAVLLDEFVSNVVREQAMQQDILEKQNAKRRITGVLDPITQQLTGFESKEHLVARIDAIYRRLDSDESGGLNLDEVRRRGSGCLPPSFFVAQRSSLFRNPYIS